MLVTCIASVSVWLLGKQLLGIFTDNETIIQIALSVLFIDIVLEHGRVTVLLFLFTLRSAGDIVVPVIIELFCMWFFAVCCGYLFGIVWGFGLAGMWIAFAMDEWSRGIVLALRWRTQKWKKRSLIQSNVNLE